MPYDWLRYGHDFRRKNCRRVPRWAHAGYDLVRTLSAWCRRVERERGVAAVVPAVVVAPVVVAAVVVPVVVATVVVVAPVAVDAEQRERTVVLRLHRRLHTVAHGVR